MNNSYVYQAMLLPEFETPTDAQIEAFLGTTTAEFYQPEDIVDWKSVEAKMDDLEDAIRDLSDFCNSDKYGENDGLIQLLLRNPKTLEVIRLLMSLPPDLQVSDERAVPARVSQSPSSEELRKAASLLVEIGIWNVLKANAPADQLVRVCVLAKDAEKRRFRREDGIHRRVLDLIHDACTILEEKYGYAARLVSGAEYTDFPRGGLEFIVEIEQENAAAIAIVLQMTSGGRQQRDLRQTYPLLQKKLNDKPMKLILIADGRGFRRTPRRVLKELFDSVFSVLSINQATQGMLVEALATAYRERKTRSASPIDKIIESYLSGGKPVSITDLPTDPEAARMAIATFATERPQLGLQLTDDATRLTWKKADKVNEVLSLLRHFEPDAVLSCFCDLVGARIVFEDSRQMHFVVSIESLPYQSERVLLTAHGGMLDTDVVSNAARKGVTLDCQLVVILFDRSANMAGGMSSSLPSQSRLARNVIRVDTIMLGEWAMSSTSPSLEFAKAILSQADLVKISPYVWQGPTPTRMFFGRSHEEATIINILASNSVAVLGSRRTGKTSLLQRITHTLNDLGYSARFVDCQTVRDWRSFGETVAREWNIEVPPDFRPASLFHLIDNLKTDEHRNLVIILDEVDQLLAWDLRHSEETVPEAFFKACRAISNSGRAQFIFSGERTIAMKLADPQSPHWNFCQPVRLQQLDRESTQNLVVSPLRSLQVRIDDPLAFSARVWAHTSGHPQIAQYLGDSLIRHLNEKSTDERTSLSSSDITKIAASFEYRDHYVRTYWGQAEPVEKLITLQIIMGKSTVNDISSVYFGGQSIGLDRTLKALDMLKLYGILEQKTDELTLRATWFSEAVKCYGPIERQVTEFEASIG